MKLPKNLRPKYIKGFENQYGIARCGQVYSFKSGKFLALDEWNGYLKIDLWKDGQRYKKRVHRLVAEAYIPVPEHLKHIPVDKLAVDHIDSVRTHNNVENLQWLTPGDNNRKSCNKPVAMDNIPLIFSSQTEAAQFIYEHSNSTNIHNHINNKLKTVNGYKLHRCTPSELQILDEFTNWID